MPGGKNYQVQQRKQLVLHLANFARSSVFSRLSCRFMSSHWATLLSRLVFCSVILRWPCFRSATVPNRSSLKPNRLLVVEHDNTCSNISSSWRSKITNQEHWWLSEDTTWLWVLEKSSPKKKLSSVNCQLMCFMAFLRCFIQTVTPYHLQACLKDLLVKTYDCHPGHCWNTRKVWW